MPSQLPLDLPPRAAQGREDFIVSDANALAVAQVEDWRAWPQRKLVLVGPEASGKTHLAHVWATMSGAQIIAAAALPQADIPALTKTPVAVEDAERIAGDRAAEEALFHLHNLLLAEGGTLLMTARIPPHRWPLTLPDLKSRAEATATATLQPPDDALLAAVLEKLIADRQLTVAPGLVPYLVDRMERSFAAARDIVERLDRATLGTGLKLTPQLAGKFLDNPATPAR